MDSQKKGFAEGGKEKEKEKRQRTKIQRVSRHFLKKNFLFFRFLFFFPLLLKQKSERRRRLPTLGLGGSVVGLIPAPGFLTREEN